jgi:hypothetical protein
VSGSETKNYCKVTKESLWESENLKLETVEDNAIQKIY